MSRHPSPLLRMVTFLVATSLLLSACASSAASRLAVETDDRTYDAESARRMLGDTDATAYARQRTDRAAKLRSDALVDLRATGADGQDAATLITRVFPAETPAVPVRLVTARWDARPALLFVEAYGDTSGHLTRKRLWVLERESGAILFAAAAR